MAKLRLSVIGEIIYSHEYVVSYYESIMWLPIIPRESRYRSMSVRHRWYWFDEFWDFSGSRRSRQI